MSSPAASSPKPKLLQFCDLTDTQRFNLGHAIGVYNEQFRAQKLPDGTVSITSNSGREIGIEELLRLGRRLKNNLSI